MRAAPTALEVRSPEELRLRIPRPWPRWKFIPDWPPRLQSRSQSWIEFMPCDRCHGPAPLYWTDVRIWRAMHRSWWKAVLCFPCLRWLVEHPQHVDPVRVAKDRFLRLFPPDRREEVDYELSKVETVIRSAGGLQ